MPVRFIKGRAGTGKTHHCLQAVRSALGQSSVEGPRLILLVPEQAALQIERAVLDTNDLSAAHRVEVSSFRRLARRVLDERAGSPRTVLSETARQFLLRHLLSAHAADLPYLGRCASQPGVISEIGRAMTEFIQADVDPRDLASAAEPAGARDAVRAAKCRDLARVYEEYLSCIEDRWLDPSQELVRARRDMDHCQWLHGAKVWVDGFAFLTRQELLTLVRLAQLAECVEVTALAGSSVDSARSSGHGLFARTETMIEELTEALHDVGIDVADPLNLEPREPPRFGGRNVLASLERHLAGLFVEGPPVTGDDICVRRLPNRRLEVEYAIGLINDWVTRTDDPLRYRDVAIIARDLGPYHDYLSEGLAARDIPFFIDRRRTMAHHPSVELVRALIQFALRDCRLDDVIHAMKTGLGLVPSRSIDAVENYVRSQAIQGFDQWKRPWKRWRRRNLVGSDGNDATEDPELDFLNRRRQRVAGRLRSWMSWATAGHARNGAEWAQALRDAIRRLKVPAIMQGWIDAAEAEGDLDEAAEHRGAWQRLVECLDDLTMALGGVSLSLAEFAEVMEAGLSSLTFGMAPPMVDQVLVGSIERSRHPELKVAIILGMNDGVFPAQPAEETLLNDDDRFALRAQGVHLLPPAVERIDDESMLVYVAMTRAGRNLYLLSSATDEMGNDLRPSPVLKRLAAWTPALEAVDVADPYTSGAAWDIHSETDVARRLVAAARSANKVARTSDQEGLDWGALYELSRDRALSDPVAAPVLRSLEDMPEDHLSVDVVSRIEKRLLRTSLSRLEQYAACPFKFLANRALDLEERPSAALGPMDFGQVYHAVLEQVLNAVIAQGADWAVVDEQILAARIDQACAAVREAMGDYTDRAAARDRYLLLRVARQLQSVLAYYREAAAAGLLAPFASELRFGLPDSQWEALELATPGGRKALIRGVIDRLDVEPYKEKGPSAAVVIDYKRKPGRKLDLGEAWHGLSLQLCGYLLAAEALGRDAKGGPLTPIAALYATFSQKRDRVNAPDEKAVAMPSDMRPRGVIRADRFGLLEDPPGDSGTYYNVRFKNDGSPYQNCDAVSAGAFNGLLERTRERLGALVDRMVDGDVGVHPVRLKSFQSPCKWCAYGAVCGFDVHLFRPNYLATMPRAALIEDLEKRSGESGADD